MLQICGFWLVVGTPACNELWPRSLCYFSLREPFVSSFFIWEVTYLHRGYDRDAGVDKHPDDAAIEACFTRVLSAYTRSVSPTPPWSLCFCTSTHQPMWLALVVVFVHLWTAPATATAGSVRPPPDQPRQNCSFPSPPKYKALPSCPELAEDEQGAPNVAELAWQLAPIVYMHPLEPYKLQSPDVHFERTTQHYQDETNATATRYQFLTEHPPGSPLGLAWSDRRYVTLINSTKVTKDQLAEMLAGAELDADGHSTAHVFYTVFSPETNIWGFTYHLFYPFNGCSQQRLSVAVGSRPELLDMRVCPLGIHEGDWEFVSVLACKADGSLKQVAYSQHAWNEVLDCEAGECPTEEGHPVTHAALESHANYPVETDFMVYEKLSPSAENISVANLGGLYLGDRPKADPRFKFVPTRENIRAIPPLEQIVKDGLTGWDWALFGGGWGAALQPSAPALDCFDQNQTTLTPCPPSPARNLFDTLLRLAGRLELLEGLEDSNNVAREWVLDAPANDNHTYYYDGPPLPDINGPLYRTYSYIWSPQRPAPIHKRQSPTCPAAIAADMPDTNFLAAHLHKAWAVTYLLTIPAATTAIVLSAALLLPFAHTAGKGAPGLAAGHVGVGTGTAVLGPGCAASGPVSEAAAAGVDPATPVGRGKTAPWRSVWQWARSRRSGSQARNSASPPLLAAQEQVPLQQQTPCEMVPLLVQETAEAAHPEELPAGMDGSTALPTGSRTCAAAAAGQIDPALAIFAPVPLPLDKRQGRSPLPAAIGASMNRSLSPTKLLGLLRRFSFDHRGNSQPAERGQQQQQKQPGEGPEVAAMGSAAAAVSDTPTYRHAEEGSSSGRKDWEENFGSDSRPAVDAAEAEVAGSEPGLLVFSRGQSMSSSHAAAMPLVHSPTMPVSYRQGLPSTQEKHGAAAAMARAAVPVAVAADVPSAAEELSQGARAPPSLISAAAAPVMQMRGGVRKAEWWAGASCVLLLAGAAMLSDGVYKLGSLGYTVMLVMPAAHGLTRAAQATILAYLTAAMLLHATAITVFISRHRRSAQASTKLRTERHNILASIQGLLVASLCFSTLLFVAGAVSVAAQAVLQLGCGAMRHLSVVSLQLSSLCLSVPHKWALGIAGVAPNGDSSESVVCLWNLLDSCLALGGRQTILFMAGGASLVCSTALLLALLKKHN